MKGIVFNLLEEVVREHGEDTWDGLLDAAHVEGAYTSLGSYPDRELMQLVAAASSLLQKPPEAILRWFSRSALFLLVEKYPNFFQGHQSTRSFLLTLNDVIHPEVRKIYAGADVPEFTYDTASAEFLDMEYKSSRKLCAFAEGLVEGAAAYFHEEVIFQQPKCMHRGDDRCLFRIAFTPGNARSNGQYH